MLAAHPPATYVKYSWARPCGSLAVRTEPRPAGLRRETARARRREQERLHELRWHDVEQGAAKGKIMLAPVSTTEGRPVLVMRTHMEADKSAHEANLRHFIYWMEQSSRCAAVAPMSSARPICMQINGRRVACRSKAERYLTFDEYAICCFECRGSVRFHSRAE